MLFWLPCALIPVFTVLGILLYKKDWEFTFLCSISIAVCSVIAALVMGATILTINSTSSGDLSQLEERREMLEYQYINNVYDNDNDLGKRDLYEDIQEYNETLAYNKQIQNDFWIGIFVPNIYDELEFIELK